MNIAINTIPLLSPLTGAGHYIYQISKAVREIETAHHYTYFYGYYSQRLVSPGESHQAFSRIKETIRKTPLLSHAARNLQGFLNHFSSRKFDLYFEPHFIPLNIPARHTVAAILDFSFARFPEWHREDKVGYFQKHFWKNIKKADHIIVISNFIKKEAVELFGFSKEQITVIHLGFDRNIFKTYEHSDLRTVKDQYHLPENFILFVGSVEPRKNLMNLLRAYETLGGAIRKQFKLVIAGFRGWKNDKIMAGIKKLGSDVLYLGYVPDMDLGKIYNLARLFVYPSFYEGFGLPPLEAMACGCPVIVSRSASLPEVCGEAAIYVDPHDVENISDGMRVLLNDDSLHESLKIIGLERARLFSWEKTAEEHLRVFEKVLLL